MSTQAFTSINTAAMGATTNAAGEIRALTETVFDRLRPHIPGSHSIRERVFRDELAFRRGAHPPILESTVVEAANTAADMYGLSEWMQTSAAQLHLFRTALRPYVPALIGDNEALSSGEMSPAEAGFVILYLYQGKLREAEYQVPPDRWVQWWTDRAAEPSIDRARLQVRAESRSDEPLSWLEAEFSQENSVPSESVHKFLDDAGFQR